MARNSIIVELTSVNQPDLTAVIGNERAVMVSQLLNSSREYHYVTNCRNIYEQIRFDLLPVAQKQVSLVELDGSDSQRLFDNVNLCDFMHKSNNVLINAYGDFDKQMRDKLIIYAMASSNVNLSLLSTSYLVSKGSRNILIFPNGVHNVVVSAISNETKTNNMSNFAVATSKSNAKPLYLELINLYKLNAYELDNALTVYDIALTEVDTSNFSKVYIEHGNGFSSDDVEKAIEIAETVPQLYVTNHKVLYNYTSSDILMSGIITDEILDRLKPLIKKQVTEMNIQSRVKEELVLESSSISANPLD